MAQSLAKVLVHVIFSTKCRQRLLTAAVREELHAYLVGTLRNLDSPAILVNSVEDHVYILCSLSRKYAISKLLEGGTSPSRRDITGGCRSRRSFAGSWTGIRSPTMNGTCGIDVGLIWPFQGDMLGIGRVPRGDAPG